MTMTETRPDIDAEMVERQLRAVEDAAANTLWTGAPLLKGLANTIRTLASQSLHPETGEVGVLAEVAAERARQIIKGYDAAHDDEHTGGDIALEAARAITPNDYWANWVAKDVPRRARIIGGIALAVAEVERLDRAALEGSQ